jgi:hypothetical protein
MKRFLAVAILAMGLAAAITPDAKAWSKFNFSTGLNLGWQTGGGKWAIGIDKQTEVCPQNCGYPGYGAPVGYPVQLPGPGPKPELKPKSNEGETQPIGYRGAAATNPASTNYGCGNYGYYYAGYSYPYGYYYYGY